MSTVSHDTESPGRLKSRRDRVIQFGIRCDCGERLRGKRRRTAQTLRCPHCGSAVFVLPADRVRLGPERRRAPWVRRTWRRVRRRTWRAVRNLARMRRPRLAWPKWASPTRAIAVAVCLVLGYTVWTQWQRSRQSALAEAVRNHRDLAESALRQAKLHDAHDHYRQALDAMQRLVEPYPRADRIARRAREVALVATLCSESLEEAMATCVRHADPAAYFASHYRGASVVLDCWIAPVGAGLLENDAFRLDYGVVLPNHELLRLRVGQADLPGVVPLHKPRRLVLGARLDRFEVGESGKWLWLDASNLLSMTDVALLEAAGWTPPADVARVVAAQQTHQEAEP